VSRVLCSERLRRRAAAVREIRRQLGLIETFMNNVREGFPLPETVALQRERATELQRQLEALEQVSREVRG
jgi:transcriptional regulator of met regulon